MTVLDRPEVNLCGGQDVEIQLLTGGGFFLASEDLGRLLDHSFLAYCFSFPFFFKKEKKIKVTMSSRTLIPLFYARINP